MRVSLGTIDVSDRVRRALRQREGKPGLATREEVRSFVDMAIDGAIEVVTSEYDEDVEAGAVE